METNREEQRWTFALESYSGQWSMTELCERYGISRPTLMLGRSPSPLAAAPLGLR